ncbi:MAG: extracellular solute-binding protein [Bacteroidetes bacterium]|nr:extracellular solute-binding protein [Bacteroidota bacterium]
MNSTTTGSSEQERILSRKHVIGLIILVIVVLSYVALFTVLSHSSSEHPVEIYFADRMTEGHRILIERFNTLNEGKLKVVPVDFPFSEFSTDARKEVLARSLRGEDDAIDIFAVDIIGVHRFAKWSESLEAHFSQAEREQILPLALQTCIYNNELVAMPFDLVQAVLYYREDLLKTTAIGRKLLEKIQAGITWEEFMRYGTALRSPYPYYIFPASDYEGFVCSYIENLLSLKPNYFETHGFRFTTPEGKAALAYLVALVQQTRLSPPIVTTFTEQNSFQYFIKNNGLFIRGWTIYDKDFQAEPVDSEKQKYLRKAMLPYPAGGRPASLFGGWNLMISKTSKKKDAAIKFLKFLLSEESQEIMYTASGYYPVLKRFYTDSTYMLRYPEVEHMKKFMTYGVLRPVQENYTKYSKIMARYFSLAVAGKLSIDEAIRETQAAIDIEEQRTQ